MGQKNIGEEEQSKLHHSSLPSFASFLNRKS